MYSAQVKVYAYIILHDLQVGKSAITFMSRDLDDIDMVFKKISDNLNSSVHTEEMRMHWFAASCCVENLLSTMKEMLCSAEHTCENSEHGSSAIIHKLQIEPSIEADFNSACKKTF